MARRAAARRRDDGFAAYAARNLFIRDKAGAVVPLRLNAVQRLVHARICAQRARTGRVRMLVLKARQPGVSTYVEGRFYWLVTKGQGMRAFILTHLRDATEAIFEIASLFHGLNPDPEKPRIAASNARELVFKGPDGGYRVGTAGSRAIGRGMTVQLFHGSEVAHWPRASVHMAGAMQAVPDADGTEIVLESTANGPGGLFHDLCRAAQRGEGAFELAFIPWFAHTEYRARPPARWTPPAEWAEYGAAHGLSRPQLYWGWRKNEELARACAGDAGVICWLFRQEYPATAEEAFRGAARDGLIRPDLVAAARRRVLEPDAHAPLVLGVDIARGGGDLTRMIDRSGRRAGYRLNRTMDSRDLMEVAGVVGAEIERLRPDMCFLDGTGIGAGVYDRLRERGFRRVTLVNFGARPTDPRRYANKRAEMWGRMAEWLADPGGADIVDDEALCAQLCAPGYGFDSTSRLKLEAKEDIRAREGASPDAGDALALTFAETIGSGAASARLAARAEADYRIFAQ